MPLRSYKQHQRCITAVLLLLMPLFQNCLGANFELANETTCLDTDVTTSGPFRPRSSSQSSHSLVAAPQGISRVNERQFVLSTLPVLSRATVQSSRELQASRPQVPQPLSKGAIAPGQYKKPPPAHIVLRRGRSHVGRVGLAGRRQETPISCPAVNGGDAIEDAVDGNEQPRSAEQGETPSSLSRQNSLDWLRDQIAVGKTPEEVYPLLAEQLADPKKIFSQPDQLKLLTDCVRYGQINAAKIEGKDAVMVLGNTGAGKSTFINYLAGCQLVEQWDEDHGRMLVVKGKAAGGVRDEVMPIGHGGSKTSMPHVVEVDGRTYCDCPGFNDDRGAAINIANVVNIRQALSRAASIRMVVLASYYSLAVNRGNSFQALLGMLTDLLGSEAAIGQHKHSILIGISKCPDPTLTRDKLWQYYLSKHAPARLAFLQDCLFMFNPLSPAPTRDRSGCLRALGRLKKVSSLSPILSVSLKASDFDALHDLVHGMREEISKALEQGELTKAATHFRHLGRLSVLEHGEIDQLLASTRARMAGWIKYQETRFRRQYARHDFSGAESLLSALGEGARSFGFSALALPSRAELDRAYKAYETQERQVSALAGDLSLLRETLSAHAGVVAPSHAEVLNLFEKQQAAISAQLQAQELAFTRRMERLEIQQRDQHASYASNLAQLEVTYQSALSRREAGIRQETLGAAEQAQALSVLQNKLASRYQSELQAQEAQYTQALSGLAGEQSAAESTLDIGRRQLIAEQEQLLLDQKNAYEELLGELQNKEEALAKLRRDLAAHQSQLQALLAQKLATDSSYAKLWSELQLKEIALQKLREENEALSSKLTPPQSAQAKKQDVPSFPLLDAVVVDKAVWERYLGNVGAEPALPADVRQIMDSPCPFWAGKQVADTHLLVLIPERVAGKALTLDYLGQLIQRPQSGGHGTNYRFYPDYVRKAAGDKDSGSSYWVLMTRDVLPGSRNKCYEEQCNLVEAHAGLDYVLPRALEASVTMLLHHVGSGERLYGDVWTRCRDRDTDDYPLVVGGFSAEGVSIGHNYVFFSDDFGSVGVACLRKF